MGPCHKQTRKVTARLGVLPLKDWLPLSLTESMPVRGWYMLYKETEAPEYSSRENSPQPRTSDSKWESIISPRHFFFKTINSVHLHIWKMNVWKNMVQEIRAGLAIITVICQRQCMVWKITSCISKRIRVQFIFHLPNIDILASPKRRLKRSDKASEIEQHNRLHRRWFKPFAVC